MNILYPISPNNRNSYHPRFGLVSGDRIPAPSKYIGGTIADSDAGKFPETKENNWTEVNFSQRIGNFMNATI